MKTLAEVLSEDVLSDEYFNSLFSAAELQVANTLLTDLINVQKEESSRFSEKELHDILRFADILSHSPSSHARNMSYKALSVLVDEYGETELFQSYASAVLSKLGNFPGLRFIEGILNYKDSLPIERELERHLKSEVQKTPSGGFIFTDAQFRIREQLDRYDYYSFSGPTSIGKSFIIKNYIWQILNKTNDLGGVIVIVVPTRALISQVVSELHKTVVDPRVNVASHPVLSRYSLRKYKNHVLVFTPERLLSYVSKKDSLPVKYLFVDEAQKIVSEADSRSSLYYHAIYETSKRYAVKLIFASPNIPNPELILKIFEKSTEGSLAVVDQTVAQNRYLIDLLDGTMKFYSDTGEIHEIGSIDKDNGVDKVILNLGKSDNNLVYCNGVDETIRRALDFAKNRPLVTNDPELASLQEFVTEYVHEYYFLIECLSKGVAFHHGRIPQKIRSKIEELFGNRDSKLTYVFCTSTLLEGVNLPAKNIFVLSDNHGGQKFGKIDFENLIGRAGRLTQEFSGNVICLRDNAGRWESKNYDIIKKSAPSPISSFLTDTTIAKKQATNNLAKALEGKELAKSLRVGFRENLEHYSSIMLIHYLDQDSSALTSRFLEKKADGREILVKTAKENRVPLDILKASSSIKPKYQNRVLKFIEDNKSNAVLRIDTASNNSIYQALEVLYDLYSWDLEESNGKDPLIPSGLVRLNYGKSRLKYWAMLLRNWTRSEPLSRIIGFSIQYHREQGEIWFYDNGQLTKERFIESPRHINVVINKLMNDIENGLRFKIEKYFLNYYLITKQVLGESNAGVNWSEFIEYGTTDERIIELQNIGFSRLTAKYMLDHFSEFLEYDEDINLNSIKEKEILFTLGNDHELYEEVLNVLRPFD